jgi:hypothetical protein
MAQQAATQFLEDYNGTSKFTKLRNGGFFIIMLVTIYKKGSHCATFAIATRGTNSKSLCFDGWLDKIIRRARSAWAGLWGAGLDRRSLETGCVWSLKASPRLTTPCHLVAQHGACISVADCEVTISWGDESTCGIFSSQSDRWLGGALQLNNLAELAEPAVACNPLDNPNEPNAASPLPNEGYGWVAGPYSPPGSEEGERVRTVNCMGVDGVVVNDTFCIDPTVPDDEQWRPADSTTSRPLAGKIALISRGVCPFITKGAQPFRGDSSGPLGARLVPQVKWQSWPVLLRPSSSTRAMSRPGTRGSFA